MVHLPRSSEPGPERPGGAAAESGKSDPRPPSAPRVVAIGGGHGLSNALRATRRYAGDITAIVTVADDGGIVLTVMPTGANSRASARIMPITPPFDDT